MIAIYNHMAGLLEREAVSPRMAELDRLIAADGSARKGRPRGAKNKAKNKPKRTELPMEARMARPYHENGLLQREAHRRAWEARRERGERNED